MKELNILLIEDNEGDILLTKEAFEESKISNRIQTIKDGRAAIDYFESMTDQQQFPNLVLLDINLPKISGHDVLSFMRQSERFKGIPVVMLSTSSAEKDILQSYQNNVNCYITKPIDIDEFIKAIRKIEVFWSDYVAVTGKL